MRHSVDLVCVHVSVCAFHSPSLCGRAQEGREREK